MGGAGNVLESLLASGTSSALVSNSVSESKFDSHTSSTRSINKMGTSGSSGKRDANNDSLINKKGAQETSIVEGTCADAGEASTAAAPSSSAPRTVEEDKPVSTSGGGDGASGSSKGTGGDGLGRGANQPSSETGPNGAHYSSGASPTRVSLVPTPGGGNTGVSGVVVNIHMLLVVALPLLASFAAVGSQLLQLQQRVKFLDDTLRSSLQQLLQRVDSLDGKLVTSHKQLLQRVDSLDAKLVSSHKQLLQCVDVPDEKLSFLQQLLQRVDSLDGKLITSHQQLLHNVDLLDAKLVSSHQKLQQQLKLMLNSGKQARGIHFDWNT